MMTPDTPISAIRPAAWRANYVLKPDLRLLATSIREYGWTAPILARRADSTIIDGFHRWVVAQNDRQIRVRDNDLVPVTWVDVDQVEAMMMHVRINRARGQLMARPLSEIVRALMRSKKFNEFDLARMLEMSIEEFELLSDGTLLKIRKVSEHKYSSAWVPVEAPTPGQNISSELAIERPPNKDR
jgi:ParB-like chromosome segregation protein Spo0J